jgi:hypothetical protein
MNGLLYKMFFRILKAKGLMSVLRFTPQEAIDHAEAGQLENWIHRFLVEAGHNEPMSAGLKKQPRWWVGPRLFPLSLLIRCCGPEEGMAYPQPVDGFNERVNKMLHSMAQGWQPPPLIVTPLADGTFSIHDGNHRHEAFRRQGTDAYWTIFWFDTEGDREQFLMDHPQEIV